jgi:hypothetical protein
MSDALVLERLQEAVDQPPPSISFNPAFDSPQIPDSFRQSGERIIEQSKRFLADVKNAVARARRHPDHPTRSGEAWASLEPILSRAIELRASFVRDMDQKIVEGRALDHPSIDEAIELLERVLVVVRREHRSLVEMYYLLKADADELNEETRGQGHALSNREDVRAYFKHAL